MRRRPELAGLPIIVGGNGDPNEPRKVVTCASYPARKFGVHAGMPLRTAARKCPDATFLPLDTAAYDEASEEVMTLLRDFGHPVEVWGWDEAYVGADVDNPDRSSPSRSARSSRQHGIVVFGRHQRQQAARQGRHRVRQAGRHLSAHRRELDGGDGRSRGRRVVGRRPEDRQKACRHGYYHRRRPRRHRCHAAYVDLRPDDRAVDSAAGQGRRRHQRQRRTVGAALAQPRHHLREGPDRPRRNRLRCSRTRAADAHRDRGPRSRGHPGGGDRAHQHVLHQDQDPQAARRRASTQS